MSNNQITNLDDVIDSRDVIARIEELEEQSTERWVAGWNMPGYMRDSEPAEFDCFEDARDYIVEELERVEEELAEQENDTLNFDTQQQIREESQRLLSDIDNLKKLDEQDFGQTIGDYHYWITKDGTMGLDEDEQEELDKLKELAEEGEGYSSDWQYGATLIRDSYFKDYAMELAEDIGAIDSNASWPNNCIDWDRAARELRYDYSSVEFDGVTYWVR